MKNTTHTMSPIFRVYKGSDTLANNVLNDNVDCVLLQHSVSDKSNASSLPNDCNLVPAGLGYERFVKFYKGEFLVRYQSKNVFLKWN